MLREAIRLGDTTSHGGRVITANPRYSVFGKPIACVGDMVVCPLCKIPTVIVEGDSSWTVDNRNVAVAGCKTSCGAVLIPSQSNVSGDRQSGGTAAPKWSASDVIQQAAGAVKQIVNDFVRDSAATTAATLGAVGKFTDTDTGEELSSDEVAQRIRGDGKNAVPITQSKEVKGAELAKQRLALGMIPVVASAVISRGRSIMRDPKEFAQNLERALKNSRSPSEAMGKLGGEKAAQRLGLKDDPRYIDRYHGPDGMKYNSENRLTELEYKGTKDGNTQVAKNSSGDRQGSKEKNRARADLMVRDKSKKVGIPSNRQGGPYLDDEIDLWAGIKRDRGEKDHVSVHTNTETGEVTSLKRDSEGEISETLDQFKIDDFDAYKNAIFDHFTKGTK